MSRKAYVLEVVKDGSVIDEVVDYLYDIDHQYTDKALTTKWAKMITYKVNRLFRTNYSYQDLFGEVVYQGRRYCSKCDSFFWSDDICDC